MTFPGTLQQKSTWQQKFMAPSSHSGHSSLASTLF